MIRKILPGIIASQITGVQPMMSSRGTGKSVFRDYYNRMFGSKMYNRRYWPHQFDLTVELRGEWVAAERWCWANFKGRYWSSSGTKFVFKRSEDAVLFGLSWPCTRC